MKFLITLLVILNATIQLAAQPGIGPSTPSRLYGRMIFHLGKSHTKDSPIYGIHYKNRQNAGLTFILGGQNFGFAVSYFSSAFNVRPEEKKSVVSTPPAMNVTGFTIGPCLSIGLEQKQGWQIDLLPAMGVQSIRTTALKVNGTAVPASRSLDLVVGGHLQVRYAFWKGISAGVTGGGYFSHDQHDDLFQIDDWAICLGFPLL